jgi:Sec-independent protein translocase protein TatA
MNIVGKLRKAYSVKELLNGIEKEEDRMKEKDESFKRKGIPPKIEVSPHIEVKPVIIQKVKAEAKAETNIEINLKIDLPAIQTEFREFKKEVTKLDEELDEDLEDLEDDLLEITPTSEEGKVNRN